MGEGVGAIRGLPGFCDSAEPLQKGLYPTATYLRNRTLPLKPEFCKNNKKRAGLETSKVWLQNPLGDGSGKLRLVVMVFVAAALSALTASPMVQGLGGPTDM